MQDLAITRQAVEKSNDQVAMGRLQNRTKLREQLREQVLRQRAREANSTEFDQPITVERTEGNVVRFPAHMSSDEILKWTKKHVEAEKQMVNLNHVIDGIPLDVAYALTRAIQYEYGEVGYEARFSAFFGMQPPPFISIPIDAAGNTTDVYVGEMSLPGFEDGTIETRPNNEACQLIVSATIRKSDSSKFAQLMESTKIFLEEMSLYKGRAITLDFKEVDDTGLLTPRFWDVSAPREIILNDDLIVRLNASIFFPLENGEIVEAMGAKVGKKVLLHGDFGTGKTLTAYLTAQTAVRNGYTFMYLKNIEDLDKGLATASRFGQAVIFIEDAERAFTSRETIAKVQLALDGIDNKERRLMVVMTSNYIKEIPQGMRRPGRLDAIIQLKTPDAATAVRLVKFYAREQLAMDADLDAIGKLCEGIIPAMIEEIVSDAKMFAAIRVVSTKFTINEKDIQAAILAKKDHLELVSTGDTVRPGPLQLLGGSIGEEIAQGFIAFARSFVAGDLERSQTAKINEKLAVASSAND